MNVPDPLLCFSLKVKLRMSSIDVRERTIISSGDRGFALDTSGVISAFAFVEQLTSSSTSSIRIRKCDYY